MHYGFQGGNIKGRISRATRAEMRFKKRGRRVISLLVRIIAPSADSKSATESRPRSVYYFKKQDYDTKHDVHLSVYTLGVVF